MEELPFWLRVLQALGPIANALATVAIAGVASLIAWRQWAVANDKLVLDLFDKRFEVYRAASKFHHDVLAADFSDENSRLLPAFGEIVDRSRFLFPTSVSLELAEMRDIAVDMRANRTAIRDAVDHDGEAELRAGLSVAYARQSERLDAQGKRLGEIFAPFLRIERRLSSSLWPAPPSNHA